MYGTNVNYCIERKISTSWSSLIMNSLDNLIYKNIYSTLIEIGPKY